MVQFRNLTRLSIKECYSSESPQLLGDLYQLHYLEDFEVTINIDSTFTVRVSVAALLLQD